MAPPAGDTAERLRVQLVAGDVEGVGSTCLRALTRGDAIADRAEIVATCAQVMKTGWWTADAAFTREQVEAAATAAIALATLPELRRARRRVLPRDGGLALRLLERRERDFLDGWVELAFEDLGVPAIRIARHLIQAGLAAKPTSDAYTIALLAHPSAFDMTTPLGQHGRRTVLDVLRLNQDLLDDVWHLFEVEGSGENSLAAHDKYSVEDHTWRWGLLALAAEGALPRGRLLDASLDALERGFAAFRAQWFSAFHEALAPSPAERAARASTYLSLAASPVGSTVAMAVRALASIQKEGSLDPHEVIESIGPAVLTPAKGSATKAIALVAGAAAQEPGLEHPASLVLVEALAHPATEVQDAALRNLRRWSTSAPDDLARRARALSPGCHASLRGDVEVWAGAAPAGDRPREQAGAGAVDDDDAAAAWREPRAAITSRPPRRVEITIDTTAPDGELPPLDHGDDLLEHAAAMIEAPGKPDELERLVTSIAAAGRPRRASPGAAETVGRRAATLSSKGSGEAQRLVARVVTAWLTPELLEPPPAGARGAATGATGRKAPEDPTMTLDELLTRRIDALVHELGTGRPFTPLAAPTHRHGLIDPLELARRLRGMRSPPDPHELTAALLRLAPDAERLQHAGRAIADGPASMRAVGRWIATWADHCAADARHGARWSCREERSGPYVWYHLELDGLGAVTPPEAPLAVVPAAPRRRRFEQDPAGVAWVGSLVPALPGAWARMATMRIGPTAGSKEVAHGDPGFLDRFFDADVPFGDDAHLLLALATNDARPAMQTAAVDLAVTVITDRRCDAPAFGAHVGRLASTGLVTPARWGRSLATVAATSDEHRAAVTCAVEVAVGVAEPRRPQDLLALLELLETLLLEGRRPLDAPEARAALGRLRGGSKTARTARRLLAIGG